MSTDDFPRPLGVDPSAAAPRHSTRPEAARTGSHAIRFLIGIAFVMLSATDAAAAGFAFTAGYGLAWLSFSDHDKNATVKLPGR